MKLPKEITTVTPLSKFIALLLFLLLPIIAFLAGMQYQGAIILTIIEPTTDLRLRPSKVANRACTMDAKLCPDGSAVGRTGPNCEFDQCPTAERQQTYTDTLRHMSFTYPADWKFTKITDPLALAQDITRFDLQSPDYQLTNAGYQILSQGAEIQIHIKQTDSPTIDDYINKNSLLTSIAKNKAYLTIAGLPAQQYNYSYEGTSATQTIFIKDSTLFEFTIRYPDSQYHNHFDEYTNMLNSFQIAK